jgi:hypothetical protein
MLIKLRNEFYQVQCDAFGNLATDLLDIRPKILRAIPPGENRQYAQPSGTGILGP